MPSDTANPATVLIAAESLDLSPTAPRQDADAAVRTARSARDEEDLVQLLDALGLPHGGDDLAPLLPHLATAPARAAAGRLDQTSGGTAVSDTLTSSPAIHPEHDVIANLDPMTREVALSMRAKGDSPLKILAATGLDENDLQRLIAQHPDARAASPYGDAVDELLAWADQHPQAKVRRFAEQARESLDKLIAQRTGDQAVAKHEAEVAALKARLQRAEQALRDAKAGKPTTTARTAGPSNGTDLAQPADKATRNAIRAWAAQQGHTVADRGVIPQAVLRAWHEAHADSLAQAG
ncbi:histone-like nucleoid-structuring protein Lsr2 [Kitasatospora sp. NPDC002227]|uniref:Lsr2 family DNA-binding protein n=1 Tax=Kitasatospora sp. NPDC002227 TaxID=3154773 RepID=UPI003330B410